MQAIILAAGMGRRLGELTKDNTKCMIPVNGIRLIDRVLKQLEDISPNRVIIVTGFKGRELKEYLDGKYANLNLEYIDNPIYDRTNNIYSLAMAMDRMVEDDTILLESDLIFEDGMIRRIVSNPSPNLAMVAKYESWMDGTMVRIDEDLNIVDFITKDAFKYSEADSYYKTVNIYKFSKEFSRDKYIPFLNAYMKAVGNNEYYENVLRIISFLNSHEMKALPVSGCKWYEIDDKQDLDIAEALFADEEHVLKKFYGRFGGYWRFPQMMDFCYLVNPFFPSDKIVDEIQANFRTLLTSYPSGMKINSLLASKCWGVKEEFVIPGNGAAELIKILMERLEGRIGIIRPTFEEYPNRISADRIVSYCPGGPDFRYDVEGIIRYYTDHRADALVVVNPDNPSGNYIRKEEMLKLIRWCTGQGMKLVIDESFTDFSQFYPEDTLLDNRLLKEYTSLVVIKSISKSYGVPGLRLGILASGDTEMIAKIKKEVSIWNINSFAEYFMQILSKSESDYRKANAKFVSERQDFESKLQGIGCFRIMPSEANYFLAEVLPPFHASEIVITLLKKYNILTRDCSSKIGFDDKQYMRISVKSHSENAKLIAALSELTSSNR